MTREEQIKNAALDHRKGLTASGYFSESECRMGQDGFYQGAEWADENPHLVWHKYPDEKPPRHDESYLVAKGVGWIATEFYPAFQNRFLNDGIIYAWAELPQPPKFD